MAKGASFDEAIENVDVGGPTMLRAAAKNFRARGRGRGPRRLPAAPRAARPRPAASTPPRGSTSPRRPSGTPRATRPPSPATSRRSRRKDGAYARGRGRRVLPLSPGPLLREGAGPALRREPAPARAPSTATSARRSTPWPPRASSRARSSPSTTSSTSTRPGAWSPSCDDPACVIIKHTNPCGTGLGETPARGLRARLGVRSRLRLRRHRGLQPPCRRGHRPQRSRTVFVEAVIAPGFEARGQEGAGRPKKNLRVMDMDTTGIHRVTGFDLRRVMGGLLAQEWDLHRLDARPVRGGDASASPTDDEWKALLLAWTVVKHVKSNAIVFANAVQTVGVGAGQMSRVDSARIAALKAQLPAGGHAWPRPTPSSRSATASTRSPRPARRRSSSPAARSRTKRSSPRPTSTSWRWSSPASATSGTDSRRSGPQRLPRECGQRAQEPPLEARRTPGRRAPGRPARAGWRGSAARSGSSGAANPAEKNRSRSAAAFTRSRPNSSRRAPHSHGGRRPRATSRARICAERRAK